MNIELQKQKLFQNKLKVSPKYSILKNKIKDYVYPILKNNPFFGPNIKKLKGEFDGLYRYRIGKFRLFYVIKDKELLIIFVDISERKDSYK